MLESARTDGIMYIILSGIKEIVKVARQGNSISGN